MRWLVLLCLLVPSLSLAATGDHIILIINDDIARGTLEFYRDANVDSFTDGELETPSINTIAAAGTRLNQLHGYGVCSPTRASLAGYGLVHRPSNLTGDTHTVLAQPADYVVEIDYNYHNLFRQMKAEGYSVAIFGKWHLTRQVKSYDFPPESSEFVQIGADAGGVMIPANVGKEAPFFDMSTAEKSCLGHRNHVVCDFDGLCTISTAYTTDEIADAAIAHMAAHEDEQWFYWIGFNAPHSPQEAGEDASCTAFTGGTYLADNPSGVQDDRPPGTALATSANRTAVYEEMVVYTDTKIGTILDQMNNGTGLDSGDGTDVVFLINDNGIPGIVSRPAECADSYGIKGSPYPCGSILGAVAAGGDIAVGGAIPDLHHVVDVPKTLVELAANGRPSSPAHDDGTSFYSCLVGTPANCVGQKTVCYVEWGEQLGGNTDGTLERLPLPDTDAQNEWDRFEVACYHDGSDGTIRMLHRTYAMTSADPSDFFEVFLHQTGLIDMLPDATAYDFETSGPDGGALTSAGMSTAENAARIDMQREINGMFVRNGARDGTRGITLQGSQH